MQEYTSTIHVSSKIVARRPTYVRLALWFLHHPAWVEPHGWVPVYTHSTPVLTSVRRLWVAYVVHEPNQPQEDAQLSHGSGAEFRTTTQTQTSQPASPAQCVPMECADVPDVCNAGQSNDPQPSQQHDEPDDWDPDAKLKLKVGDVTVTVKQHRGSSGRQQQLDRLDDSALCAECKKRTSDVPVAGH